MHIDRDGVRACMEDMGACVCVLLRFLALSLPCKERERAGESSSLVVVGAKKCDRYFTVSIEVTDKR